MPLRLTQRWQEEMLAKIAEHKPIDVTSTHNLPIQWLIVRLSRASIPYKVHQLDAGVKRITTDTDTCPCRKKPLKP
jgi:hypothetical protein